MRKMHVYCCFHIDIRPLRKETTTQGFILFSILQGDEKNAQPKEKANVLDLLRKSSMRTTTLIFCFVL